MPAADLDARQMGRDQRHRYAELFLWACEMIGVIGLERQAQQRRDGTERDVALVPVQLQPQHLAAFKIALADDAGVDHRGGIGAGLRAGEAEAGNVAAIGEPRQPFFLLLPGAEAHQQFAGAERVRHHHGDGCGQRARRQFSHHFGMRIRREAEPAELLRDDHAEEFFALDEVPGLLRQVAPFPIDLPLVEHPAELVDRAVEKRSLLVRQRGLRVSQKLRPVGMAGEEVGVPPDVAGLQRLALGLRHGRQHALCPGEDRFCDEVAAEAHGETLMKRRRGGYFNGKCRTQVNCSREKWCEIDAGEGRHGNGLMRPRFRSRLKPGWRAAQSSHLTSRGEAPRISLRSSGLRAYPLSQGAGKG